MSNVRIQDDLYEAVNGDWLKDAVIPADRPTAGGISELDQGVEKKLMADFAEFAKGTKSTDIKEVQYAIELYKKYINVEQRDKDGIKPLLPILHKIQEVKTVADLNKAAKDFVYGNIDLPFNSGVTADMGDATKNSFIILGPSTILPDTSYYAEDNQAGKQLLEVWKGMAKVALAETDLTEDEQASYLADAVEFDALVAKKVKSQIEWADYTKCHNPMKASEVAEYLKPFDFASLLADLYGDKAPETVVIYDPRAIKEFNGYFNKETFTKYIHWAYIKALLGFSSLLSTKLSSNAKTFRKALMGVASDPVMEKQAYQMVSQMFSEPIGVYYGRTYFGEEAKKDIISLVKKIIETYKVRVQNNNFLEAATKEKAIKKLSTIVIKMGYPDTINEFYSKLVVDSTSTLFDAAYKCKSEEVKNNLAKLLKPVDRTEWGMPGHMVNACYNPSANDITFPAAILQKPFYGLDQSVSTNLGGIGCVIGHEISHAFDNNGAQFDENGNLFNWWTEKDYAGFKKNTQAMIDEFEGIPFHGGKVQGELVVSENIADNGGMAVCIEIMHNTKGADFQEFFKNWARIWCQKAKEEYILFLLSNDVHAPTALRANIQPRNFDEWYEAFGVTDKDQMYIEPSKRVRIW